MILSQVTYITHGIYTTHIVKLIFKARAKINQNKEKLRKGARESYIKKVNRV